MNILITGSGGLVGSALTTYLTAKGHHVRRLVRKASPVGPDELLWDPAAGGIDSKGIEGQDAVVHLAGENIASRRWTANQKFRIRESRVAGTRFLCESLAALRKPPRILISASAIGYYGDRGDEILREDHPPGAGFLPDLCRDWEQASAPAAQKGIRVVNLRIGIVLSRAGGALSRMLVPFRLGLGGPIGSGLQYMSWISIDDIVGVISHALATDLLRGAVNGVAPTPVTNAEFTKTLGRVLSRPTVFPMPAAMARLAFGEMADALLLASARVDPARLEASGYLFRHRTLEEALRHLLE